MNKHSITVYYSEDVYMSDTGWYWYYSDVAIHGYPDHGPFKTESLARKDSDFRMSVGSNNIAVGYPTLSSNTTGTYNPALGNSTPTQ
jgi:hypothetical protein